jgi:hypothetical protein
MIRAYQVPDSAGATAQSVGDGQPSPRGAKTSLSVVASVNDSALRTWAELWEELKPGVTPAGLVLPEMDNGVMPPGGWPEFLEKLWLLKHYLDYIRRFCEQAHFDLPSR